MKKPVLLVALFLLLAGGVAQASYIGAVSTEKRPVQFSLGGGVSHVRTDINVGANDSETTSTQLFGQFSFDVKGWQIDLGGGAADWKMRDPGYAVEGDLKTGMLPFVRAGIGGPLFRGQVLTVAPYIQASAYKGFEENVTLPDADSYPPIFLIPPVYARETMEFDDIYEGVAALRFQIEIEGAQLYAGPAYFWLESEVTSTVYAHDASTPPVTASYPAVTNNVAARDFGGLLGVRWILPTTGARLDLEMQYRNGATWTGALSFPF